MAVTKDVRVRGGVCNRVNGKHRKVPRRFTIMN